MGQKTLHLWLPNTAKNTNLNYLTSCLEETKLSKGKQQMESCQSAGMNSFILHTNQKSEYQNILLSGANALTNSLIPKALRQKLSFTEFGVELKSTHDHGPQVCYKRKHIENVTNSHLVYL